MKSISYRSEDGYKYNDIVTLFDVFVVAIPDNYAMLSYDDLVTVFVTEFIQKLNEILCWDLPLVSAAIKRTRISKIY
jgi:hypothetical protein